MVVSDDNGAAMRINPPLFLIPTLALALVACSSNHKSISNENKNPLVASRYGEELADSMANFIIMKDPAADDPVLRKIIESEINRGKDIAAEARKIELGGAVGAFLSMRAETMGYALYLDDVLYLSSDFVTTPGPSLKLYLTTMVDPRDGEFPDETSIDLGIVQATYGQQQYSVPRQKQPEKLRTVVLYDTKLKMIYGFAQISKAF